MPAAATRSVLAEAALLFLCSAGAKLLLYPAYRSTDFEVHRNWLAITHSRPPTEWYADRPGQSEWTLDYPPLFAWFEWLLGHLARLADPAMLAEGNHGHASPVTVLFQRATVVATEALLLLALLRFHRPLRADARAFWAAVAVAFLQPGLLLVDHVHFQYNGFLFGLLVLALALVQEQRYVAAGVAFAALLNLKHLFLYALPAVFVWLFSTYCIAPPPAGGRARFWPLRLIGLGAAVLAVFAGSLGPWVAADVADAHGDLAGGAYPRVRQLVARLFPFGRGLCHAYWAPNFWALYNVADKLACTALLRAGHPVECRPLASRGLVGTSGTVVSAHATSHAVLPHVSPAVSLGLVAAGLLPMFLAILFRRVKLTAPRALVLALTLSSYSFFLFGWHVHEKAALMLTLPLALLASDASVGPLLWRLTFTSTFALFPLLFRPLEWPIRWCVWLLWAFASPFAINTGSWAPSVTRSPEIVLLPLIEVFNCAVHPLLFGEEAAFLPLLLTSVSCAVFMVWYWLRLYALFFGRDASPLRPAFPGEVAPERTYTEILLEAEAAKGGKNRVRNRRNRDA